MTVTKNNFMWNDIKRIDSSDKNVAKFVFKKDTAVAEAVLYKYPTYEDRTVICCSTQSGCAMGCRFCGTGDYFVRSLTADEIAHQPEYLLQETNIDPTTIKKLQIMFMSMGEPMNNFNELASAMKKLYSKYPNARLLISTSAPRQFAKFEELEKLSVEIPTIGLQFSVHESTDEERKKLIPAATMTLQEIANTGNSWHKATGRKPFFNYCLHDKNNSQADVDRLLAKFDPAIWEATLSVICERDEHVAASNERQRGLASEFAEKMLIAGYNVRVFNPAGADDIGGGCGQLWYVQEWMRNNPDKAKKTIGFGKPIVHTPRPI